MAKVKSTQDRIVEIVADQMDVDPDEINMDTKFIDDLGVDSLDTVELTMEIEEEFDVTVSDEDAAKLLTVGEVVNFVDAQLA
jgi:acyl carrier protein